MLPGKPAFFSAAAAFSASARLAKGPTRTRVRLPSAVLTTWVYVFRPAPSALRRAYWAKSASAKAPICTM